MTASALTRPVPRPLPGAMPEPRTPGAVWHAWEDTYTLQRGGHIVARVVLIDDETLHRTSAPMPLSIAHHVCADIAAVTAWLARGGR